ncbi:MAG: hypothetical protein KKE23_02475 [Nanoarchaeota archaeon]|nr:hypothetical protein [Nanoarchaeota archaeon]
MKRGVLLLFVTLGFLILSIGSSSATIDTSLTPYAVYGLSNVSVNADGPPALYIHIPKAGTYFINTNLPIKFGVNGATKVTVLVKHENTIISFLPMYIGSQFSNGINTLFFNTSYLGTHSVNIEAVDEITEGPYKGNITKKNVTFTIDTTALTLIYSDYTSEYKGASTNLYILTIEELQDLAGFILEDTRYGEIEFLENVNITDDENPLDNIVNINGNVKISFNKIFLNSTALPNLNKRARIYLYNLSFIQPIVLKDGIPCPNDTCTGILYSNGLLKFDVTNFSTYSAKEGYVPPITPGRAGGGAEVAAVTPVEEEKEIEVLPAPALCIENWKCSEWSVCTDGKKVRSCVDENDCGTNLKKPEEKKGCITQKAIWITGGVILITIIIALIILFAVPGYWIFAKKKKNKFFLQLEELIYKTQDQLEKGEIRKASNSYKVLNEYLQQYKSKISKRDFKILHEKGMKLYDSLLKKSI